MSETTETKSEVTMDLDIQEAVEDLMKKAANQSEQQAGIKSGPESASADVHPAQNEDQQQSEAVQALINNKAIGRPELCRTLSEESDRSLRLVIADGAGADSPSPLQSLNSALAGSATASPAGMALTSSATITVETADKADSGENSPMKMERIDAKAGDEQQKDFGTKLDELEKTAQPATWATSAPTKAIAVPHLLMANLEPILTGTSAATTTAMSMTTTTTTSSSTTTYGAAATSKSAGSKFVTVTIAGKNAATYEAKAAEAAKAAAAAVTTAAALPPTLSLMRAPIQPTPVPRILPKPAIKKQPQQAMMSNSSQLNTTTSIAPPQTVMSSLNSTTTAPTKGGNRTMFTTATGGKKAQLLQKQQNSEGDASLPLTSNAPTKFPTIATQQNNGAGKHTLTTNTNSPVLTPTVSLTVQANEFSEKAQPPENNSTLDKFTDTVNKVAAGAQLSPPPSSTVPSSSATTAGQQQKQEGTAGKAQIVAKPRPKKKKPTPKSSNGEERNQAGPQAVDGAGIIPHQQQESIKLFSFAENTPSVFPLGVGTSSDSSTTAVPAASSTASGMIFPNFALAAPNGVMAYPSGGTQYYIRQVVPSQQQFYISSSMPPCAVDASSTVQTQTDEMFAQQQQQLRNLIFRNGNEIYMPAMVSGTVNSASSPMTSPQISVQQQPTQQKQVQQQQKYIQPRPLASKAALGHKAPHVEVPPQTLPPMVMLGGVGAPAGGVQQLPPQYFLTPTGAIVALQPHSQQQHQQAIATPAGVRLAPNSPTSSTLAGNNQIQPMPPSYLSASKSTDLLQKNGIFPASSPSPSAGQTCKMPSSSPKRKRKVDETANNVAGTSAGTSALSQLNDLLAKYKDGIQPFKDQQSHPQMPVLNAVVDEEENEPPPILCRVFNRPYEPSGTQTSVESVFQREAKIIRERMFDAKGRKLHPLKHCIDGFEIEEDIEPFPCEHQHLLNKLKKDQHLEELERDKEKIEEKIDKGETNITDAEDNVSSTMRLGRKRAASSSASSRASSTSSSSRAAPLKKAETQKKRDEEEGEMWKKSANGKTDAPEKNDNAAKKTTPSRRRELESLLKMDFGKHTPFQTSDPDKYAREVLIEAKQQQRTLALAQEERFARRSVESSSSAGGGGGGGGNQISKRDKHAKKPFSPPTTPTTTGAGGTAELSRSASVQSKGGERATKMAENKKKVNSTGGKDEKKSKKKTSPKTDDQRRSGGTESEENEERCLYCRRSFKEVPKDKDHVQYCSKACRKQLKAAKRIKHSADYNGGELLNSSIGAESSDNSRNGVPVAPINRRISDTSAQMTPMTGSPGQQQQHIISPLGSAFSAMQPQMLSKRRLPVDQHAEQLMSLSQQRLSSVESASTVYPPPPAIFGQSPPGAEQPMLAMPMAMRPTPPASFGAASGAAIYFNAQQMTSTSAAEQHHAAYQQMLFGSGGTIAGNANAQHFFPPPPAGASGTASPFMPTQLSTIAPQRQQSMNTTVSSSSPVTPVPTPTSFLEHNAEIDALVVRGVQTWTKEEVGKWANFVTSSETNGDRFVDEDVDGSSLLCLNQELLKTELKFKLGPALKLGRELEKLKRNLMC